MEIISGGTTSELSISRALVENESTEIEVYERTEGVEGVLKKTLGKIWDVSKSLCVGYKLRDG
jgi:hypothetical protein